MTKIRTHYDNLKVARDAPPEVIRAAYKTLSQKFHPDRNPGSATAPRIMAILNTSYEVLSDPDKREKHNRWVAEQEQAATEAARPEARRAQPPRHVPTTPSPPKANSGGAFAHVLEYWSVYAVIAIGISIWASDESRTPPLAPKSFQASPAQPSRPQYVRPNAAPNGQPWPAYASYVKGYHRLNIDGLSTVRVDNSLNDSDVFVKLVSLDSAQAYPVRNFYIPAFGTFTLNKVTAGSYDIRYRDLGNGGLSRSEAFNLEETPTYEGTQFSNITMTLYKVKNGNMQTYGLSEAEF